MAPVEFPTSIEDSTDPLVPLLEAARLAYFRINGKHTGQTGALNRIARLIAGNMRVFSRAHAEDDWRPVMPGDVHEGAFQLGGAHLEFSDKRPSKK